MRYQDFRLVESNLAVGQLLKNPQRVQTFLQKIQSGQEFQTVNGDSVKIDPSEYDRAKQFLVPGSKGTLNLKTVDGNVISTGKLAKTAEFGGQGDGGKEKLLLKPSHIFPDGRFPASKVFDAVINNSVLQGTDYGNMVIKIAKEIQAKQVPDMSQIPKEFKEAIRDYAGEYLGVLAMINGTAEFPNRDKWLNHLGIKDLNEVELFFPKAANHKLADSVGYFKNTNTGNMILVSSKGGAGAAPAFDGLKIPDNLRTSEYENEIEFIETMQTRGDAFTQPFYGLNIISKISPQSLPQSAKALLPLNDDQINQIVAWGKESEFTKDRISELPEEYQNLIKETVEVNKVKDTATLGGIIQYGFKNALKAAVNNNNALPNFEPLAREILQYNFVQIHTDVKRNQMTFEILWPNKQMGTGKITVETKYSANDPNKGKMSFKVARN
jgi:hypothetical protein